MDEKQRIDYKFDSLKLALSQEKMVVCLISVVSIFILAYSIGMAIKYSGQPILDWYTFRQTQTALTSYWMCHGGFKLAYETPVGGYPWALPLEFPLYQYLVAKLSCAFDL
jgi:hypothetical protein